MSSFKPTPELINVTELLLLSMAHRDTLRPIVIGYKKKVLEDCQFHISSEWTQHTSERLREEDRIILDPEEFYLLSDEDADIVDALWKAERDKLGLHVENDNQCPLLVANSAVVDCEHLLIDTAEPLTGMSRDMIWRTRNSLKRYHEYLELLLKLLVPFCDAQKRLAEMVPA